MHAENTQLLFSSPPVSALLHFLLQFLHCQNSLVLVMKYALLFGGRPFLLPSPCLPLLTWATIFEYVLSFKMYIPNTSL